MKKIKQHLLLMLLSLCCMTTYAYDFEVDGLYYNLISASEKTCELVGYKTVGASLVIPDKVNVRGMQLTVASMSSSLFAGNNTLKEVVINAPMSISKSAFDGCVNLHKVYLGDGVKELQERAFYNCSIQNLSIPSSVTSIGKEAIYTKEKCENIRIEEGNASITLGESCMHVDTLYMGRNVSEVNSWDTKKDPYNPRDITTSIQRISGLHEVLIGHQVTELASCLFYGNSLQRIVIPKNVIKINNNVFKYCDTQREIVIEDSDTPLEIGVNYQSVWLYSGSTNSIESPFPSCNYLYIGRDLRRNLTNQQEQDKYNNLSIFSSSKIQKIEIGNKVTSLCDYMFQNQATPFAIPSNVTHFGNFCCYNTSFIHLNIDRIEYLGTQCFSNCKALKTVNLGNLEGSVRSGCFNNCPSLHKVSMKNVSSISEDMFGSCKTLNWIDLGNASTINTGAFKNCTNISTIGTSTMTPPSFVNKNEFSAINKFDATIYIPNGSTSAYEQADVWKDFLFKEEKPMPEYVYNHTISESTSKNMVVKGDLTGALINQINASNQIETLDLQSASIVLDNQNAYYETGKRIENPYQNGDDLNVYRNAPYYSYKYYTAPTTVSGSEKEYSSSGKLINVITNCFSSELTNANLNGSLKSIKLPSSLSKLGENAIVGTSLAELYATSTTPPVATASSFGQTNKTTCVLYVPEGCKSAYSTATGWKDFKNIVEAVSDNYISVQPTNENRKVQLARQDAGAKYQWYKYIDKTDKVIDITNLLSASSGCWENTGNGWLSNMHAAESSATLSCEHDFYAGDVLSFDWSVSSEEMFDQLQCYLGDELLLVASGEKSGSFNKTIESAISGKLTFVYIKDNITDNGNDNAVISNVKISSSQERTMQVPEAIDGETGNVLQAGAVSVGDKVFCIVTLCDGKQLKSNEFVIEKLPIPSDKYCLVLEKKDGSLEKYVLSDRPEISISNKTVTVTSEKVQTDCPIVDFVRFYFEENKADEISVNTASTFVFKYNENMVRISGAEKAEVYSADGMKLLEQCATNGEIRMNISNLTPGLYLIKTDKKTIKIRK